jgi:hypothetical protein
MSLRHHTVASLAHTDGRMTIISGPITATFAVTEKSVGSMVPGVKEPDRFFPGTSTT